MRKPKVKICRRGRAHLGEIEMPIHGGRITVQTLGWDPMSSLRRAAAAALQITSDPRLAPFMPPQVTIAAHAVRALSKLSPGGLKAVAVESDDPGTRKLAIALLKKVREQAGEDAEVGANPKYRFDPIRRGPQSNPRKYTGPRRGRGRPSPRGPAFGGQAKVIAKGTSLHSAQANPYDQMQPVDQYGQPVDQYGQPMQPQGGYGQPGGYSPPGVNPSDPNDATAMAAWGANAFDQPSELQPEYEADDYFRGFEESYHDGSQEDVMEYEDGGDMEPTRDGDVIVDQETGMRSDGQPTEPQS